ncbi:DUF3592 domain-containing protein [Fulvivirga sediminis]|uniref:DUF3592 domain-containing protein n=1 Tax=Fulvivirga sediminis TaxID=2803949 RepID=A0A937FAR9_9BACT|nr:DUF3592 domain-containing protein [Fulvivirga sediminis]MBL3658805.1 DUF3592 domain-containing protein [Fulvivirga sediminis]
MKVKYKEFGCVGVFGIVILLIFSAMLIYTIIITTQSLMVYSWTRGEAKMLFSKIESSSGGETDKVICEYEYHVKGNRFTNDRLAVGYGFSSNIEDNGRIANLSKKDNIVKIYINPSDPQEANLIAGLHHSIVFMIIVNLLLGSIICFFSLLILAGDKVNIGRLTWGLVLIWACGIIYLVTNPLDISIADKIEVVEVKDDEGI